MNSNLTSIRDSRLLEAAIGDYTDCVSAAQRITDESSDHYRFAQIAVSASHDALIAVCDALIAQAVAASHRP